MTDFPRRSLRLNPELAMPGVTDLRRRSLRLNPELALPEPIVDVVFNEVEFLFCFSCIENCNDFKGIIVSYCFHTSLLMFLCRYFLLEEDAWMDCGCE